MVLMMGLIGIHYLAKSRLRRFVIIDVTCLDKIGEDIVFLNPLNTFIGPESC